TLAEFDRVMFEKDIALLSNAYNIYVSSVSGVDTNNGLSASTPVKTIARALVFAASSSITQEHIYIRLKGGEEFRLTGTIGINIPGKVVKFMDDQVASRLKPIIKGSILKAASDFTLVSTGIYRTPITKLHHFITVNGEMRLLASTVRYGKFYETITLPTLSGVSMVEDADGYKVYTASFPASDITKLATMYNDAYITVFKDWVSFKMRVLSVNTSNNTITFAHKKSTTITSGSRYIIENINTTLSVDSNRETFAKGSYYTTGGYLYYKLKDDETILNVKIELPQVEELFKIESPCVFINTHFSQAYHYLFDDPKYCTEISQGRMFPCSINVYSSATFSQCEFSLILRNAIGYHVGSKDSSVVRCIFHDLGAMAVRVGEWEQIYRDDPNTPKNIHIYNSVVKDLGRILDHASGISLTWADTCSVTHCDVSRLQNNGITLGYSWSPPTVAPSALTNCRIAYNYIHHAGNFLLADFAGIYIIGDTGQSVIEYNRIH
ncbi:right-handed parallel beta-helix repeat-containing protein, partial [Dysgonomonas alginatilytica]|uniref:right-handed parallel beta-helix repeat-containing protein n=1 Tax=Dysgonomonas alginatilytica TaxID=1605892 RepID=UPI0014743FE7